MILYQTVCCKTSLIKNFIQLQCAKPVIAAVHGACIGGAVDMICSADIRYCSSNAFFQIKEVDLGLAADVGTLQRLPKIIGSHSLVKELAYTARKMMAPEALTTGFVSQVLDDEKRFVLFVNKYKTYKNFTITK